MMSGLASKTFDAGAVVHLGGETARVVDRDRPARCRPPRRPLVVLAEAGCHGARRRCRRRRSTKSSARTRKPSGASGEVGEQRLVGASGQLGAGERADHLGGLRRAVRRTWRRAAAPRTTSRPVAGRRSDQVVGDVRPDGQRQVGRQGPRRGRPGQDLHRRPSSPGSRIAGRTRTVSAGSWRGRVASSRRISKLDSGVSAPHEYGMTL